MLQITLTNAADHDTFTLLFHWTVSNNPTLENATVDDSTFDDPTLDNSNLDNPGLDNTHSPPDNEPPPTNDSTSPAEDSSSTNNDTTTDHNGTTSDDNSTSDDHDSTTDYNDATTHDDTISNDHDTTTDDSDTTTSDGTISDDHDATADNNDTTTNDDTPWDDDDTTTDGNDSTSNDDTGCENGGDACESGQTGDGGDTSTDDTPDTDSDQETTNQIDTQAGRDWHFALGWFYLNGTFFTEHDHDGRMLALSVITPYGNVLRYEFDLAGNLVAVHYTKPGGGIESFYSDDFEGSETIDSMDDFSSELESLVQTLTSSAEQWLTETFIPTVSSYTVQANGDDMQQDNRESHSSESSTLPSAQGATLKHSLLANRFAGPGRLLNSSPIRLHPVRLLNRPRATRV